MEQTNQPASSDDIEDEINLTDLVLVLLKWKRMIILLVVASIIASVIYSFLLTKIYTATARILPPQKSESGLSGILSSGGGALEGLGLSLFGGKSSADVYAGILESRTVADILIKKFNLQEIYKEKFSDQLYKTLADNTKIQIS